jgi:hypothetical protein
MKELYRGQMLADHYQVALFDAEDNESYPEWESDELRVIFGTKGVVVPMIDDDVDVVVYEGEGIPDRKLQLYAEGIIFVGNEGLLVGNGIANDLEQLAVPSGKVRVSVYVDGVNAEATRVAFVIGKLAAG